MRLVFPLMPSLLVAAGVINLYDSDGHRAGRIVEGPGGRVDVYDARSNRTGYGYIRGDDSVDVFNVDGTRRATITPGIGGQPARIVVPRGKR